MARTKYDLADAIRSGNEVGDLADEFRPRLESRCEAGLIDGLKADVLFLAGAVTTTTNVRLDAKSFTTDQNEALDQGANLLSLLRNALTTYYPLDKGLLQKFGVGGDFNMASVPSATAAFEKFIAGTRAYPEKARAAGVLPDDVTLLQNALATLTSSDRKQEKKRASSKVATSDRNAAHARVEVALDKIHALSRLVFRNEPEIRARFDSAMPTSRAAKNRAKRKAAAKSATPA